MRTLTPPLITTWQIVHDQPRGRDLGWTESTLMIWMHILVIWMYIPCLHDLLLKIKPQDLKINSQTNSGYFTNAQYSQNNEPNSFNLKCKAKWRLVDSVGCVEKVRSQDWRPESCSVSIVNTVGDGTQDGTFIGVLKRHSEWVRINYQLMCRECAKAV